MASETWRCGWCGAETPLPTMGWGVYETACPHCEAKYELQIGYTDRVTDGLPELRAEEAWNG